MTHYSLPSLPTCSACSWSFVSMLNSWTQNCRKSQILRLLIEGVLTKAREICPRFNFVYKLQCFQPCLRRKKNVQGILVLHLAEISKEFLIFIDLKITETRFTVPFRARSLLLNINILFAVSVTHVHVNTLNYALIFYPFMNTVKPQV